MRRPQDLAFEDALHDDWSRDAELLEVPIGRRPLFYVGLTVAVVMLAVLVRVLFLNLADGTQDRARAAANAAATDATPAPRGLIYDKQGTVLADNTAAFAALLDTRAFLGDSAAQSSTLAAVQSILGLTPDSVWGLVQAASAEEFAAPIVLSENVSQSQLVQFQALSLSSVELQSHFERTYPQGPAFASVVGYTGRPTSRDLAAQPELQNSDAVGKAGVEMSYDDSLRGTSGESATFRNAKGEALGATAQTEPQIGNPLHLTIDGGLQTYFYNRLQSGLQSLGRTIGLGIAMDPQTGQILSLVNLPGYDNSVFASGTDAEISQLLTSPAEPLFDRAVSGMYNPGSTIKPLDAVAALKEGVITPDRSIYSPGYLLVPDPYNSSTPGRYLDWQPQGYVDMKSAIAQSSDVYFYVVGGGSPIASPQLNDPSVYGIQGLGIERLNKWWQTFGLGVPTGVDLPGEAAGFLPTAAWKQKRTGTPWLLGDTYNVSIGQGDLLLTPLQLLDYVSAIANGGKLYRPYVNAASTPALRADLTSLAPQIGVVQEAMRDTVTMPRGTAYTLHDLPFPTCAKTGSAQVKNNQQENALFVGYAPCPPAGSGAGTSDTAPQIAVLVLIENSRQGSLNAVPIAKDVLNWYYENRLTKVQH
jgi:penicillin-binding protein 2